MSAYEWPINVLTPHIPQFDIHARTEGGVSAIDGTAQVASSAASLWHATFNDITIVNDDQRKCILALAALLDGRANKVIVPMCFPFKPSSGVAVTKVPHSDATFFSDGSGYIGQANSVQFANAAIAGATSANIAINFGGTIEPPHYFTFRDHLHRIVEVDYTSSTTATIKFKPGLRYAASAADELNFDDPTCLMRLATDGELNKAMHLRLFSSLTVRFIEAF